MARRRRGSRLLVGLNGRRVGMLDRAASGAISFVYDREWLEDERRAIPVSLSLPLREERYTGAVVSAYFENLLPDNDEIRRIVAERVGCVQPARSNRARLRRRAAVRPRRRRHRSSGRAGVRSPDRCRGGPDDP